MKRNNISATVMYALLHTVISVEKGDASAVNISYASIHRYNVDTANVISTRIKFDWKPPAIAFEWTHWMVK